MTQKEKQTDRQKRKNHTASRTPQPTSWAPQAFASSQASWTHQVLASCDDGFGTSPPGFPIMGTSAGKSQQLGAASQGSSWASQAGVSQQLGASSQGSSSWASQLGKSHQHGASSQGSSWAPQFADSQQLGVSSQGSSWAPQPVSGGLDLPGPTPMTPRHDPSLLQRAEAIALIIKRCLRSEPSQHERQ